MSEGHEHRIAVAAMQAAVRARRLRNQSARARNPMDRAGLKEQAEALEGQIVAAANMLIDDAALRKTRT